MEILENVKALMRERGMEKYSEESLWLKVVLVGSGASDLKHEDSDIDVRMVVKPTEEDVYGLYPFEHTKLVEGEGQMNGYGELDVEIFSTVKFIKGMVDGFEVVRELSDAEGDQVLYEDPLMKEIEAQGSLFNSKKVVKSCLGFYNRCYYNLTPKEENIKSESRLKRVKTHGYDTKKAETGLRMLGIAAEYLETGKVSMVRGNVEELKKIRSGKVTYEEVVKRMECGEKDLREKLERSDLPKGVNVDKVNEFLIEFNKKMLGVG